MALRDLIESLCTEAKLPKHYIKRCDRKAVGKNVRYFMKKKGMPQKQAVAASLSAEKRACGVKDKKQRMTPKEIERHGQ